MNFKTHAKSLAEFLHPYSPIWREEIMNAYPQTIQDYPLEWIQLLDTLSVEELFDVDCKRPVEKIQNTSLNEFIQTIKKLTEIEFIPDSPEYPLEAWAFHGIKKKKKHEIQKIVPVLKRTRDELKFEYVVDIGGGVGHLSRVLSHYHHIPSISIDRNPDFQNIGRERLKKFRKLEGAQEVTFMNLTFGKDEDKPTMKRIFNDQSLSLGLHTCGPLANILIKSTVEHQTKGLLSFGCCYHSMNPEVDFPLSSFYKENNFPAFNLYGLSLATRSHAEMSFDTYKTKEQVKKFRYALHLFLMRHYDNKYFASVGECHISTYWKPFHVYITDKLKELNIIHSFSAEYFDAFYSDPKLQKELRVMYLCNIIRWQLGRALEVYLQLDRCLYLEEQGYNVQLMQFFDEALSPRNLGILATKTRV